MVNKCEHCEKVFKTSLLLEHHINKTRACLKYRDVIFSCRKCKYIAKNIKDVEQHTKDCKVQSTVISDKDKLANLEEERQAYQVKAASLECKLTKLDRAYRSMKMSLHLERLRSKVYGEIVSQNMGIDLLDVMPDDGNGLHVYNIAGCKLDVIIHDYIHGEIGKDTSLKINAAPKITKKLISKTKETKETKETKVEEKDVQTKEDKPKKIIYRVVKGVTDDTINKPVKTISPEIEKPEIDVLISDIDKTKKYTTNLIQIKVKLGKLMKSSTIGRYTEYLQSITKRLEEIFIRKGKSGVKMSNIIEKCLTSLDTRLIFYGSYKNRNLEMDDLEKVSCMLSNISTQEIYEPYDSYKVYNRLQNYGLVLFSVKDCIQRVLVCNQGFSNIVYMNVPKATDNDPYSFYTLQEIDKNGIRKWMMDCRLENYTELFSSNILPYCITVFRKLYFDVFGDNVYRKDYETFSQTTEFDCEQILVNILTLSNKRKLCDLLRDTIKNGCMLTPTTLDKVNLYADDVLCCNRFAKYTHNIKECISVLRQVFDTISEDDMMAVYLKRNRG